MTRRRSISSLLGRMTAETAREVSQALFAGGEAIAVEAQISITAGAVSGKKHVASAPGEAPNQDTGVLGNNIETIQKSRFKVEVSSNAPYSADLEFGTSKMEARPFMAPAANAKRSDVERLVDRAVKRGIRRAAQGN